MARRPLHQHHVRILTRMGGTRTLGVSLPNDFLRALKWRRRQKIVVKRQGKRLLLKDWKRRVRRP